MHLIISCNISLYRDTQVANIDMAKLHIVTSLIATEWNDYIASNDTANGYNTHTVHYKLFGLGLKRVVNLISGYPDANICGYSYG